MVKKVNVKVTSEQMMRAQENGIAATTLYARLKSGWDMERAVTEPPRKMPHLQNLSRSEEGSFTTNKPRGRGRSFRLDSDLDALTDEAIARSGLSMSAWFSRVVRSHLNESNKSDAEGQSDLGA